MKLENYITISNLCMHYQVEPSFFMQLEEQDLISIETFNDAQYISLDNLYDVEKMIRLNHDLSIHEDNIDIVFNLIRKIENLQEELRETKCQLNVFRMDESESD